MYVARAQNIPQIGRAALPVSLVSGAQLPRSPAVLFSLSLFLSMHTQNSGVRTVVPGASPPTGSVFTQLMTSDRKVKASRQGSK